MIILAHRGLADANCSPNSFEAIEAALHAGFGIEFDVRMEKRGCSGCSLVISHDTPPEYGACPVMEVTNLVRRKYPGAMLAVNVKEEGLLTRVFREFTKIENAIYFDLTGPDLFRYSKAGLRCLERYSDTGERPMLKDLIGGLWVDGIERDIPNFMSEWSQVSEYLDRCSPMAFVSPEVHGRPHERFWEGLRTWMKSLGGEYSLALCTDLSREADSFFNGVAK